MGKHVKLTASNSLELPSDLVARKGWLPGTEFEVNETALGFTVQPVKTESASKDGFDYEAFRRDIPKHEGPPLTLEEMEEAMERAMAERWAAKEARSR